MASFFWVKLVILIHNRARFAFVFVTSFNQLQNDYMDSPTTGMWQGFLPSFSRLALSVEFLIFLSRVSHRLFFILRLKEKDS